MALHENGTVLPFHLHGTGTGVLQTVSVEGSAHAIRAEGHPAFGGTESAPSPLDYSLAALASCNQVTTFIVAKDLGITVGTFDVDVRAELDNSVLVFGAEGDPNFSSVTLDVRVRTDADSAAFDRLAAEVERRCPLTQLFARSGAKVTSNWTNDPLPVTAPAPGA